MQCRLLDWHLLLAALVGWGGGLVEGDSGGRSSGDKPPCPLSLRQQRKWVMFVWKPRAAIPLVLMCGPPGMRVSISTRAQGERKRNRTHTDLVPRTNNLSDKPAGIPRKSPNRRGIQTRWKNKRRLGGHKGPRGELHSRVSSIFPFFFFFTSVSLSPLISKQGYLKASWGFHLKPTKSADTVTRGLCKVLDMCCTLIVVSHLFGSYSCKLEVVVSQTEDVTVRQLSDRPCLTCRRH